MDFRFAKLLSLTCRGVIRSVGRVFSDLAERFHVERMIEITHAPVTPLPFKSLLTGNKGSCSSEELLGSVVGAVPLQLLLAVCGDEIEWKKVLI